LLPDNLATTLVNNLTSLIKRFHNLLCIVRCLYTILLSIITEWNNIDKKERNNDHRYLFFPRTWSLLSLNIFEYYIFLVFWMFFCLLVHNYWPTHVCNGKSYLIFFLCLNEVMVFGLRFVHTGMTFLEF
jgi:ABC-type multidrug transport system permease subunit